MGWKIGAPSLKLNNVGRTSKSCGSFGDVAGEALEERRGLDPDIDRERAELNRIQGIRTAEALMEYSRQHVAQLRDARGRKLRADAVVMCATILKPPAAYMNSMSIEDQRRFLDDAFDIFKEIVGQDNVKSRADHFDELGSHSHVFWEPMTSDGRLCAKEVHNLQFFSRVNRELPQRLREKGWDIDDCECYDAAKEEYEKAQKKNGRSSVAFKAEAEKKKGELIQEIDALEDQRASLATEIQAKEDALNAVSEPLEDLERAEKIDARAKREKSLLRRTETVTLSKSDYDELIRGYRHAAVVDLQIDQLAGEYDDLDRECEKWKSTATLLRERERILREEVRAQEEKIRQFMKEIRETRSWIDLVKSFLHSMNLIGRFMEWCDEREQAQRRQDKLQRINDELYDRGL